MVRSCRWIPGAGTAPRLFDGKKVDLHTRGPAGGAHSVSLRASIMNLFKIGNARRPVENGR